MTSISHASSSSLLPTSASLAGVSDRLRFGAGSKAVRVGLGVAIAAVMAGDVYAVLRSPVSEGRAHGSPAAATPADAGTRFGAAAGHVATNPFGEAAYEATVAARAAALPLVLPSSPTAKPAAPASAASTAVAEPAAGTVPSVALPGSVAPAAPVAPATTNLSPADGSPNPPPTDSTPAPAPESPLAPVIAVVTDTPVGPVVTTVVEQLPAPVTEALAGLPL